MHLLLVVTAAELVGIAVISWSLSLRLRDASIADIVWGPMLAIVAWTGGFAGHGDLGRRVAIAVLVTVWALRLTLHLLTRRLRAGGEDPRYAELRACHPERFPVRSLFTVFLFQASLAWVIALPLNGAATTGRPLTAIDAVLVAGWEAGLVIETVADEQLRRFRARHGPGQVLTGGLWRYTRHPNYFGELVCWWCIGLLALGSGSWVLTGPALLTVAVIRFSGVRPLERRLADRAGFALYSERTPLLVPWFPRRSSK